MSTPPLVAAFYEQIWNCGKVEAARELLSEAFVFRGSLGAEVQGRAGFVATVGAVRSALADYRCEILECVSEGNRAFAQMRFSGRHVGVFRATHPPANLCTGWGRHCSSSQGHELPNFGSLATWPVSTPCCRPTKGHEPRMQPTAVARHGLMSRIRRPRLMRGRCASRVAGDNESTSSSRPQSRAARPRGTV